MTPLRLLAATVGVAAAAAGVWVGLPGRVASEQPGAAPAVRPAPITIRRVQDDLAPAVPPARVAAAVDRLAEPPTPVRWANVLHALRLWGPAARTGGEGRAIDLVTREDAAARAVGFPVHQPTPHGVEFRTAVTPGGYGEQHWGQTMASLAEAGVGSDQPVGPEGATVRDVVRSHAANFTWDLAEFEWVAVGFALYLPPHPHWVNKHGRPATFDQLMERLCEAPDGRGACFGTHVNYAVTTLLRADDRERILGPAARRHGVERLRRAVGRLATTQSVDGSWDPKAVFPLRADGEPVPAGRLVLTGHAVEWMALAPRDVPVPGPVVRAAVEYLTANLLTAGRSDLERYYCPYTHAARGVRLWQPAGE